MNSSTIPPNQYSLQIYNNVKSIFYKNNSWLPSKNIDKLIVLFVVYTTTALQLLSIQWKQYNKKKSYLNLDENVCTLSFLAK